MWIDRILTPTLKAALQSRPVILLTGARQTGKSSLLAKILPNATYLSFDNLRIMTMAKENPDQFLAQTPKPVVLDEIQNAPELFRSLKILVDADRQTYGQWILTGSQQFALMENVSESLAGRMSILHLETLSAQELRNNQHLLLEDFLWKGGYPELWANPNLDPFLFLESYIQTYIERDLRSIIDVHNLYDFQRFFRILSTRVGGLLNYRDLSKEVGVSDTTIRKWLHALSLSGIIYLLPPYSANIGKRFVKSPKIYFADQGLVAHLLDIQNRKDWDNHIYKGHLWENLVFMELIKTLSLRPGVNLFFYRDQNGVEIDFVALKKNTTYLIEAKVSDASSKLNFHKVQPLLKQGPVVCLFAANILEKQVLAYKEYKLFNPLYVDLPMIFKDA